MKFSDSLPKMKQICKCGHEIVEHFRGHLHCEVAVKIDLMCKCNKLEVDINIEELKKEITIERLKLLQNNYRIEIV